MFQHWLRDVLNGATGETPEDQALKLLLLQRIEELEAQLRISRAQLTTLFPVKPKLQ